jgi:hypothetical protein
MNGWRERIRLIERGCNRPALRNEIHAPALQRAMHVAKARTSMKQEKWQFLEVVSHFPL